MVVVEDDDVLSYEDQVRMVLRQLNAATAEQCLQQRKEGTYLLIVVGGGGGMMLRTKSLVGSDLSFWYSIHQDPPQ